MKLFLFEKNFSAELEKVKRDHFPVYADYLEKIVAAVQSTALTGEKVSQLFDEGIEMFMQTPPQWKAATEEVVVTLKPEQFKSFEEYFDKKLAKQKVNEFEDFMNTMIFLLDLKPNVA